MKIKIFLRTIISYFLSFILCLLLVPPCLVILFLPKKFRYNNKTFFYLLNIFYKGIVYLTFMPLKIVGKSNIPNEFVIFAANHQSAFDIPVLGSITDGAPHIWLVLEYYIKKPILGFFIKRMFVPVDQESSAKAARSLITILKFLKDKRSHLLIFPEGGRYTDGKIHDFFKGFAVIAQKTGLPVVPVYMPNNYKIYPPHSFLIYYNQIDVIIGKPIIYTEDDTPETFSKKVRDWFIEQVK